MFNKLNNSINFQILKSLIKIYLFLTLFISTIQLVNEYLSIKNEIKLELEKYERNFYQTLENAVWNYDEKLTNIILQGIEENQSVVGVELYDENAILIIKNGETDITNKTISHEFSLYKNEELLLGRVKIFSSEDIVFERLKGSFLLILINSIIKLGLLWIILLITFKKYLSSPIEGISNAISKMNRKEIEPIQIKYKYKNELSSLVEFVNELLSDLNKSQHQLEDKINERTKDLIAANKLTEKALKTKSSFLANMSHEIRTPLNGIIGMVSILSNSDKICSEDLESVHTINESCTILSTIINDILDLSKLEAGKVKLEFVVFDIAKSINQVVKLYEFKLNEKKITVDVKIDENVPIYIKSDIVRYKQVLMNLLSNSIKFSSFNKIEIEISSYANGEKRFLKTSVQDYGIGIKKENIKNIFMAFEQADSTTTRLYGGTGLGLSICSYLVKLLGGTISVESTYELGSKFTFTCEYFYSDEIEEVEYDDSMDLAFSSSYPLRILVVEDNLINQKVIKLTLNKMGYGIDIVENGKLALDFLEKKEVDIIFMDLQMPVMGGIEASKAIKEKYTLNCPEIIAMTANAFDEDRTEAFKVGMSDFIPKPIKLSLVKEIIIKVYNKKSRVT